MKKINLNQVDNPLSYSEYANQMRQIIEDGAQNQLGYNSALIEYTRLNLVRMERWDKRLKLEDLQLPLSARHRLLVITEGWCGDAAHINPIFQKLTEANDLLDLTFINRDSNLGIMDAFLTNGGRSIPKAILLDAEGHVLGNWGPRPSVLQDIFMEMKNGGDYDAEVTKIFLQKWYNKDKGRQTLEEVKEWITSSIASLVE